MDTVRRSAKTTATLARAVPAAKRLSEPAQLAQPARDVLAALDIRLETTAERLRAQGHTGTLIVANHISWIDILAMLAIEPATFLAKREIAKWPFIGEIAGRAGTQFLERWSLRELPTTVAKISAALREGRSVLIFPEATTWCSGKGGPFRTAPFQAAIDAGAPIRPVTLRYLQGATPSTISAFVGDDAVLTSIGRVLRARDLTVRVRVHDPLAPCSNRKQLAAQAQSVVRSNVSSVPSIRVASHPAQELAHV